MDTFPPSPSISTPPDALTIFRTFLARGDELDRCSTCRLLGIVGDTSVVADLAGRLRDEDIDVCVDAATALGRLGDAAAVQPLLESLRYDPNGEVKTAVVTALGHLGGDQAIGRLIEVAAQPPQDSDWEDDDWDPWWDMQIEAVKALGNLKVTQAVPVLITILEDEEGGQDIENEVLSALARIPGPGEAEVIQRLTEGVPRQRRRAACALAGATSSASMRALAEALKDIDDDVRIAAIESLTARHCIPCLNAILVHLRDPSAEVRQAAITAAARLSHGDNMDLDAATLIPLCDDKDAAVRASALTAMEGLLPGNILDDHRELIRARLNDQNPQVATAACPLAARLGGADLQGDLLSILAAGRKEAALRREVALALGKTGKADNSVLEGLAQVLVDPEQMVRLAALHALVALYRGTAREDATPGEIPAPLAMVIDALHGRIQVGATEDIPTDVTGGPNQGDSDQQEDDSTPGHEEPGDAQNAAALAPDENPLSPESTLIPPATSTLDAVALDNLEAAQALKREPITDDAAGAFHIPEEDKEELEDVVRILDKQQEMKQRLLEARTLDMASDVRCLSARVLGECGRAEVVDALKKAMQDEQPEVQKEAILSLGRIARESPGTAGLDETTGPLIGFLEIGIRDVRLASIQALGSLGRPSVLPVLLECLGDDDPAIRSQSVRALASLLQTSAGPNLREPVEEEDMTSMRANAVNALADSLEDADPGVCKTAAEALAVLGHLIEPDDLRRHTIERLIKAGLAGDGKQALFMGRAMRALDPELAGTGLLDQLRSLPTSFQRRFAMEMLEEIYKPVAL